MNKKEDFEKLILESYQLIFEDYHKIISDNPEEKGQLLQEIDERWAYIKIFLSDYTSLCETRGLIPLDEIIDIAAMRFRDIAIRLETIVARKPTLVSSAMPPQFTHIPSPILKAATPPASIQGITVYAQDDEQLCKELAKHLSLLQAEGLIYEWYDREVKPDQDWSNEIDTHVNTAYMVLLLVSSDFMISKYCYGAEMKRILERHEHGEMRVIPIILRPVDWHNSPFRMVQVLPRNAKPLTTWENPEEALLDIMHAIRQVVDDKQFRERRESLQEDTYT